ncbi:MAG: hypothetical protein ACYSVY_24050, partial [Planctomycetota bacterium]
HDRWLVIGSSIQAVNKYLATSTGTAPCILENERFKREGLRTPSAVCSLSFTDMTNLGQELSQILSLVNVMMAGVVQGVDIQTQDARKIQLLKRIITILQRLSPAVARIDFYSSSATSCTFDGLAWRMEAVTHYKPPVSPKE